MDRGRESHPSSVCILLFTPKPHKPGKTRVGSEELGGGVGWGGAVKRIGRKGDSFTQYCICGG